MAELYEIVDGKVRLKLHSGQTRVWDSPARFTFMLAGTQCMPLGSKVLMADGRRLPIEQVSVGDQVLSLGDNLKIETNLVSGSFSTGVKPVFRYVTASGRTVCVTAEHPLYGEFGWQRAAEFKVGDFIAVPRGYPALGTEDADAKQLKLLGYLLADGSLTGKRVGFTKADPLILDDLRLCLPATCSLVPRGDRGIDYSIVGNAAGRERNPVLSWVREIGINRLSKEKRMPDFVFRLRPERIAHVLQALFDCDGTVDRHGIEICLASEGLIDDLQHLLLRIGIYAHKRYKGVMFRGKLHHAWRLSFADTNSLIIWRDHIGFVSAKAQKLNALIKSKSGHRPNTKDVIPGSLVFPHCQLPPRGHKQPHADQVGYELLRGARRENVARPFAQKLAAHFGVCGDVAHSDIYWDKIARIESLGEQPTWDLTVERGHNFVAEDVFAHNSGKTSFGPWWLWEEIRKSGGGDYLAVTSTYDLFNLKMLPEMLRIFCRILGRGKFYAGAGIIEISDPDGKFWAKRATDDMWARIIMRSASAEGGLESSTAKAAWLDEVGQDGFPLEAWEAILRRLSLHQGRVLGTTTLYNCYDQETEIYTRTGWKHFNELTDDDEVMACDAEGKAWFEKPKEIYWQQYRGKMHRFKGGRIDLLVTPNHRMLYRNGKKSYVKTAEQFAGLARRSLTIPKTVETQWEESEFFELPGITKGHRWGPYQTEPIRIPMRDWCAFMGWYLSEGSAKGSRGGKVERQMVRVMVAQSKGGADLDRVREDLSRLPFKWTEDDKGFTTTNQQLGSYLRQFGTSDDRHIPRDLKLAGRENLRVLIDRLVRGDGSYGRRYGEFTYFTASPQLAEDFVEVCMLAGISTGIRERQNSQQGLGKPVRNPRPIWHIWERKRVSGIAEDHEVVDYDGHIGCVSVSSGLVLVRRNGEECISGNTGWLKQQIYDKWVKGDKDYNCIQYASTVNPAFPRAEYERAKRSMPAWKFKMFYRGEFDRPPGMIYGDYDERYHLIDPIHLPGHWPRYVGIDPGGVNLATIWIAENPTTNVLYVYRETLEGDMTTSEHVQAALERAKDENVVTWVGGAGSEEQTRRDWAANGIALEKPSIGEVWPGIDRVISLFKTKRIRIFSTMSGLRDELGRYTRMLDREGEATTDIKDKKTFHRLDSLRYVASSIQEAMSIDDVMPADMGAGTNLWGSIGHGAR